MPALTGYAANANTTLYSTFNAAYNAFDLTTVLPVLGIAAVVISLLIGGFMSLKNSGIWKQDGAT
jgi:uncharacterized membrane protein YciS (DUF1049 family)